MDDNNIQDLKQFIAATVSQHIFDVRSDIENLDKKLSDKIDNLSDSVAEAIEIANNVTDTQLKDHKQRIIRLEHKAA